MKPRTDRPSNIRSKLSPYHPSSSPAILQRKQPAAPAVYRPNAVPKVLQLKSRLNKSGETRRSAVPFSGQVVRVVQRAAPAAAAPAMVVEYTDHWLNNPSPRAQWKADVRANENAIARKIYQHGQRNGSPDDTRYAVNYRWGYGYFVIIAFYHTDGRIRFHTVFYSDQRGNPDGGGVTLNFGENQWP
jgi:hypothetical protein